MKRPLVLLWLIGFFGAATGEVHSMTWPEQDAQCLEVFRSRKLPMKLKTRGKPKRARWEQVDRVLTDLREELKQTACQFRFDSLFKSKEKPLYIPLTNNLIRTVPDETLQGLTVFYQSGEAAGEYLSRLTHERSGGLYARRSYTLYSFQFRNTDGEIMSTTKDLLLDNFLIRWSDIQSRIAINTQGEVPR